MEKDFHEKYRKMLDGKHACYVIITCDEPDDVGRMNVNFSFDGDPALAAFLIDGAKNHLEEENEEIPLFS
ncbi:hypothetical protein [Criblamydia sequanensis]|uniref:Uncharacterized protein n=1 Tax=Candidatus Criblamydia sequanensis CRIB-18 TaxID=1437425 RepID=A0A090CYS2_9BACT|nr:hypothetical protein [Criblamydia sequanensis]CDR33832.1 Conserved hypothetical protein [Criblamydia sequanensis CRIB-18]